MIVSQNLLTGLIDEKSFKEGSEYVGEMKVFIIPSNCYINCIGIELLYFVECIGGQ